MSTPCLQEFNPQLIPWQNEAIQYINSYDYSRGICEILFSGSVGSAKSVNAAHIVARHVVENEYARVLVLRRALKDLKRTFWPVFLKHLADSPELIKSYNKSEMKITFVNGSEVIGDSYDDMNLEKFRSLDLSMVIIEEAIESNKDVYDAIKMRVGRIPSVKKNVVIAVTNPDSPGHYLYEEFIAKPTESKKVFYSLTYQNPFLPSWYIDNLRRDLDQKQAQRMLDGKWVEIDEERIYYSYLTERNFKNIKYKFNDLYPICLCFDFNRSAGKPMSAAVGQLITGHFHIAKTFLIQGGRTQDVMDEMAFYGALDMNENIYIYGDASGRHTDTRNNRSDWDIIVEYLQKYQRKDGRRINVFTEVPRANPSIRARHNTANSYFFNDLKEVHATIYSEALDADRGFRLAKLKEGAELVEDDTLREQHVTTAITYWMFKVRDSKPIGKVVIV